jgi:hypothetical protein
MYILQLPLRNLLLFLPMRLFISFRWVLLLLLAVESFTARASHIRGGDITYATIASTTAGVPRYHVVVRNFAEIGSPVASPSTSTTLNASRGGCSAASPIPAITLPRTQLFGSNLQTCGTTGPLYQIAVYEVDLDLPLPLGQWVLSATSSARAATILNIQNAAAQNIYLTAYVDNSVVAQDVSPVFQSLLQPIVSTNAPTPYSMSAFDADGDSLVYELIQPANGCNLPIPYYPSTFAPHYTLNTATGALTPTASASTSNQGFYNITARVSEYRKVGANRWVLIGYVIRDTLYLLFPSTNQPPTFTTLQVNGGAPQPLSTSVTTQPGQTMNVLLQATDPDVGQLLRFASAAGVVPGLSLAQVGTTNAAQLTWQVPATLPPGRYTILVSVFDNGCPYNASEERAIQFVVTGSRPLATRTSVAATDVYPVPFREQVQFTTTPNQAVVLVDALGREVARLTSTANGLVRWQPAATLPAGLYLARSAASGQPLARLLRAE